MKNIKKPSDRIVSRIKLRKRAIVALFIFAVVITLLFLGDSHYYDGIEIRGIGLGLHPILIVLVIIIESIVAVIFYSRTEGSVEKILDEDCDPKLYYDVKRSLLSRSSYLNAKQIVDLNVSYYLGDFATCRRFSEDAARSSGDADQLLGYSFLGLSAFFLNDNKSLSDAAKRSKRLLERTRISSRTPLYADLDRRVRILEMLDASSGKDAASAVSIADSLEFLPSKTTALEKKGTLFLRAIVYESAGEKKKALACFADCAVGTEKTFIFEEAKKRV